MAQGSGTAHAPTFSQVEHGLRNVAIQFASIVSLQTQFTQSIQSWRELERELALARAAAGGTASEFKAMEKAARDFSLVSTYSAGQVANSFYNLASAGLTVKETLQAATGVVLLAQATLTDLGEASDVAASAMSQFGLSAQESYRISNLFVASTNASLSTVPKLSYALRQVGPIASQAGLSIEETVAALDKLFDAGLRGEQAGTALRNTLARIIDPVGDGSKVLDALGVSTVDSTGKMKNLIDVLEELAKMDLTVSEATSIVGIEAASGFLALMKELRSTTADGTNELRAHQKEVTNTDWAYQQAVVQLNTLDGALARAGNSFNDIRIQLGQELAPVLLLMSDSLEGISDYLRDTSRETKLNTASNLLYAASWGTIFFGMSRVGDTVTGLGKNFVAVKDGAAGMSLAVSRGAGSMTERLTTATTATSSLTKGLFGIAGAAVGIAAVTAAIIALRRASEEASKAANKTRVDTVSNNLLVSTADLRNLQGQRRDDYLNKPVDVDAYARQVKQIGKRSEDPFAAVRQLTTAIDTGNELFDLQRERLNDLENNSQETRASWERIFKSMEETFKSTGDGFVSLQPEVRALANIEAGQFGFGNGTDRAREVAQEILRVNAQYIDVTGDTAKQAIQARTKAIRAIITREVAAGNLDAEAGGNAIEALNKQTEQLLNEDKEGVAKLLRIFAENSKKASEDLIANPEGSQQYGFGSRFIFETVRQGYDAATDEAREQLSLTEESFNAMLDNMRADLERIRVVQEQARQGIPEAQTRLKESFTEFILTNNNLTKQQMDDLSKVLYSKEAQAIIDQAVRDMTDKGTSLRDAMGQVIDEMIKQKLGISGLLEKGVEKYLSIALLDEAETQLALEKERLRVQKALVDLAKLNDDPEAFKKAREATKQEGVLGQRTEFTKFFTELAGVSDARGKLIVKYVKTHREDEQEFNNAILDYAKDGSSDALNRAFEALVAGDSAFRSTPGLRNYIEKLGQSVIANREETNVALARLRDEAEADAKSKLKTDSFEKLLIDLIGLPSADELKLQSDKIRIAAEFALSDYLGMPFAAVEKAIQETKLGYRERRNGIVNEFQKIYTDTLAKGVDGVASDQTLIDAFSGDLVGRIFGTGSASVFGTEVTKEMLATADGMNKFVDIVITRFANAVAGQPLAEARIDSAKRVLIGMLNQMTAANAEVSARLGTLELERKKVEEELERALFTLNANNLFSAFDDAINRSVFSRDIAVDIELALNAEVTRVQLDAKDAIKKVQDEFQDIFNRLGIPVKVNADGSIERLNGGAADATSALVEAVRKTNDGRPKGTAADPIVVKTGTGGQETLKFPLHGGSFQSSAFGNRIHPITGKSRFHAGIDIAAATGTPVYSAASGVVTGYTGNRGGYGNVVEIDHGDGLKTRYAHLSKIGVEVGQVIAQGILIGAVGSTGRSTGPHLHFETRKKGKPVNPKGLIGSNVTAGGNLSYTPRETGEVSSVTVEAAITKEQEKQLAILGEQYKARITNIQEASSRQTEFLLDDQNASIIAYSKIHEYRMALYEEYMGRVQRGLVELKQTEKDIADVAFNNAKGNAADPTNGLEQSLASLRVAQLNQVRKQNALDAQKQIEQVNLLAERRKSELSIKFEGLDADERAQAIAREQLAIDEETAANIAAITGELLRNNEAAERSVAIKQQFIELAAQALEDRANGAGVTEAQQRILGMKAAVVDFAGEVPTMFDVTRNVVSTALNGMTDAMTLLFTTGTKGVRSAVSTMLASMGQLIAKMLAMYAVIQLISAIPGGSAVLSVLGFGGGFAANAATTVTTQAARSANIQNAALGGVGMPLSQRMQGGIRNPYDMAISIFGEGQHREAYIPMVDGQTIPVAFDREGNPFVPLPSGQRIPVSMRGSKYARGGIDNVITNPASLMRSRNAMLLASDTVGAHRGVAGGASRYTATTSIGDININIAGNASRDDANAIGDQVLSQLIQYLDARDAENFRQRVRNRGSIFDDYGVS